MSGGLNSGEATSERVRREFLFLQGLAGPFFSLLGDRLAAHGHGVHRVNFNGGDKLYWSLPGAVDFRRGLAHWPAFLTRLIQRRGISDIVLFGDCRPLHSAAIAIAKRLGLQVHVFEEGYIRPDFVTVELGGVNGHSSLERDPEAYLAAAKRLPPMPVAPGVASYFGRRAKEDLVYNIGGLLLSPFFPGYRTHRPWNILIEYYGWARRLLRKTRAQEKSAAVLDALYADGRPFFTFPLQLTDDYQIRVHSPYGGIEPAIEEVLTSFANNAPKDTLLLVKGHPLDNGLVDWEKRVRAIAERLGIADRVPFIEWGDIEDVVQASQGVVTVNSTTGTLSLLHNVPTIVLGHAVYDVPRITHQTGLDAFWTAPVAPEPAVFDAFRRVLVDRCLIRGGYFSDEGLEMLVDGASRRMEAARAPLPVRAEARVGIKAPIAKVAPARG